MRRPRRPTSVCMVKVVNAMNLPRSTVARALHVPVVAVLVLRVAVDLPRLPHLPAINRLIIQF